MIKFSERFFCPAPWTNAYYRTGDTSPCHLTSSGLKPADYFNSTWLRNIKQDFINEVVPTACLPCKNREEQGLKSTRGAVWKFDNVGSETSMNISQYTVNAKLPFDRLEVRFSNLCNFKCRMCIPENSSEIAKELRSVNNLSIKNSIYNSSDSDITYLKQLCIDTKLRKICFTGGEPMLIKAYYDFMDFLIENNRNDIEIELFTNCSVYNPIFIEKLLNFKKVTFVMSIDGVEKTAEYQRHGTKWDVVRKNILKFNAQSFDIYFNTAISIYVLLDVSSLAKFLMELYKQNNTIQTKCYSVPREQLLHHRFMNAELRKIAVNEINKAIEILTPANFEIFVTELTNIKHSLENSNPSNSDEFSNFTKNLDLIRNESFEDTFNKS